jgi:hypothetical protein
MQTHEQQEMGRVALAALRTKLRGNTVNMGMSLTDITTNATETDRLLEAAVTLDIVTYSYDFLGGALSLSAETLTLNETDDTVYTIIGDMGSLSPSSSPPNPLLISTDGTFTYTLTEAQWIAEGRPDSARLLLYDDVDDFDISDGVLFNLTCFARGTGIATPNGTAAVETLRPGDLVLTADGGSVSVNWVFRQAVNTLLYNEKSRPVRICAGAMGDGLPHSDLTVTADHGMILDGYVINASALVNGDTIDFVPMAELEDSFTVYHIETKNHDVILASGAPAETFIDAVGRAAFDNHQEYLDLYGVERIIPEMTMPRISSARLVPNEIRERLGIARGYSFTRVIHPIHFGDVACA